MIDLTGIAVSIIAGVSSILGVIIPLMIQSHFKDKEAAAALTAAVKNSLGAIQQAADAGINAVSPHVTIPHVSQDLAVGVQYVLDHAGDEAARFGLTPVAIADKISAQIGLKKIDQTTITPAIAAKGVTP